MRYHVKLFFFCLAMSLVNIAHAESFFLKGSDLYKECASSTAQDILNCKRYLVGVLDGRITYMAERADINGEKLPIGICIYGKKDRSVDDLRRAVIKKIDSDRDRYDETYGGLAVVDAIKTSFPCNKGSGNGSLIMRK